MILRSYKLHFVQNQTNLGEKDMAGHYDMAGCN